MGFKCGSQSEAGGALEPRTDTEDAASGCGVRQGARKGHVRGSWQEELANGRVRVGGRGSWQKEMRMESVNGERDVAAIILAAGRGSRMESRVQKQYLELAGRPLICHALSAFEDSPVSRVILVAGAGELEFCRREIVEVYGFKKVAAVVAGGSERYHSVYEGLKAAQGCQDVLIHDGARPCVTAEIIRAAMDGAARYGACAVGMPVKDTIKVADRDGNAACTPDRSTLWMIQTPQAFDYGLVRAAYDRLFEDPSAQPTITDDAMVVEIMTRQKVHLVKGSYENIKVTTPEDLEVAGVFLKKREKKIFEKSD